MPNDRVLRGMATAPTAISLNRKYDDSSLAFGYSHQTLHGYPRRTRRGLQRSKAPLCLKGGFTYSKRAEIVGNVLPMAFGRKIGFMLNAKMGILLLLCIVPVPARTVTFPTSKAPMRQIDLFFRW